jgi:hypothetical protein
MKGAHPGAVCDRTSQFREHFAVPLDPATVRYATVFFFIRTIEITASALGDFDDRVVVFPGNPGDPLPNTADQYRESDSILQMSFGEYCVADKPTGTSSNRLPSASPCR